MTTIAELYSELEQVQSQNALLKQMLEGLENTQEQMRVVERRYQSLALATSSIIWRANESGMFFEHLQRWRAFTGQSLAEAQTGGWTSALHPEDQTRVSHAWLHAVYQRRIFEMECRLRHSSGGFRRVSVRAMPICEDGSSTPHEWMGIITDIEDIRRAEESVYESEERLRMALEAADIGAWDWDVANGHLVWNDELYKIFGQKPSRVPRTISDFMSMIVPEDLDTVHSALQSALEDQTNSLLHMEFRTIQEDEQPKWMRSIGRVVARNSQGQALRMVGIATDISMQHEAEMVLRRSRDEFEHMARDARRRADEERGYLLTRLVAAQEDERRRLSRELHDQMGQNLTALLIGLQRAETQIEGLLEADNPTSAFTAREHFTELKAIARTAMESSGRLARELRPASLDTLGLEPAVRQLAEEWMHQAGIRAEFGTVALEGVRLRPELETMLYRIIQEALTNIARHAEASCASVLLERQHPERSDGMLIAVIEDDGCGFDVQTAYMRGRLGLLGIRERAEALGGTLQIESSLGEGTSLYVRVPLQICELGGDISPGAVVLNA